MRMTRSDDEIRLLEHDRLELARAIGDDVVDRRRPAR
jgi:hypothetical protein